MQALPGGQGLVTVRHYASDPQDPLQGRRERVIVVAPGGERRTLEDACIGPSAAVVQQKRIAFHCVREQAGNYLLHEVLVFSASGEKLAQTHNCRKPRWSAPSELACDAEEVGPDGRLTLRTQKVKVRDK